MRIPDNGIPSTAPAYEPLIINRITNNYFSKKYCYFILPVNDIVANVLRSKGGAHQRHIPCAAG